MAVVISSYSGMRTKGLRSHRKQIYSCPNTRAVPVNRRLASACGKLYVRCDTNGRRTATFERNKLRLEEDVAVDGEWDTLV